MRSSRTWRAAAPTDRHFFQGLIQVAVALHHHSRGNLAGCKSLLTRAGRNLSGYPDGHLGLDLTLCADRSRSGSKRSIRVWHSPLHPRFVCAGELESVTLRSARAIPSREILATRAAHPISRSRTPALALPVPARQWIQTKVWSTWTEHASFCVLYRSQRTGVSLDSIKRGMLANARLLQKSLSAIHVCSC